MRALLLSRILIRCGDQLNASIYTDFLRHTAETSSSFRIDRGFPTKITGRSALSAVNRAAVQSKTKSAQTTCVEYENENHCGNCDPEVRCYHGSRNKVRASVHRRAR